jgi:hypothetical protein
LKGKVLAFDALLGGVSMHCLLASPMRPCRLRDSRILMTLRSLGRNLAKVKYVVM